MTEPSRRLVASLLLVDLTVLVLVLGHFVQLHDTSGFGSDDWILPLGALAAALGLAAVVVALPDRRACRALGVVLLGGVVLLVLLQVTVDGFRFIWAGDEGELVVLDLALLCLGLVLLARGARPDPVETVPGRTEQVPVAWTVRALVYLAAAIAVVLVAGLLGATYGDAQCAGTGDDCPEAVVGSLLFAVGAVLAMVVLIATCELTLWSRRRHLPQ